MAALKISISIIRIYSLRKPLLVILKEDKAPIEKSVKYSDFTDVFLPDQVMKLLDYTGIKKHATKLIKDKLTPHGPI